MWLQDQSLRISRLPLPIHVPLKPLVAADRVRVEEDGPLGKELADREVAALLRLDVDDPAVVVRVELGQVAGPGVDADERRNLDLLAVHEDVEMGVEVLGEAVVPTQGRQVERGQAVGEEAVLGRPGCLRLPDPRERVVVRRRGQRRRAPAAAPVVAFDDDADGHGRDQGGDEGAASRIQPGRALRGGRAFPGIAFLWRLDATRRRWSADLLGHGAQGYPPPRRLGWKYATCAFFSRPYLLTRREAPA